MSSSNTLVTRRRKRVGTPESSSLMSIPPFSDYQTVDYAPPPERKLTVLTPRSFHHTHKALSMSEIWSKICTHLPINDLARMARLQPEMGRTATIQLYQQATLVINGDLEEPVTVGWGDVGSTRQGITKSEAMRYVRQFTLHRVSNPVSRLLLSTHFLRIDTVVLAPSYSVDLIQIARYMRFAEFGVATALLSGDFDHAYVIKHLLQKETHFILHPIPWPHRTVMPGGAEGPDLYEPAWRYDYLAKDLLLKRPHLPTDEGEWERPSLESIEPFDLIPRDSLSVLDSYTVFLPTYKAPFPRLSAKKLTLHLDASVLWAVQGETGDQRELIGVEMETPRSMRHLLDSKYPSQVPTHIVFPPAVSSWLLRDMELEAETQISEARANDLPDPRTELDDALEDIQAGSDHYKQSLIEGFRTAMGRGKEGPARLEQVDKITFSVAVSVTNELPLDYPSW